MNCEEIRERLDAFVGDEIALEERAGVAAHLVACAACRAEAEAWGGLFNRTAALPRSIEPPRDLWAGIDAALDEPAPLALPLRRRLRLPVPALVAAALALVVLTASLTTLFLRESDTAMARKLKGMGATPAGAPAADFLQALEAQNLPPETMAIVQRNLAVIDVAIAELEAALERDPDNEELVRMLVSTHRKRADLLQGAVRAREDG